MLKFKVKNIHTGAIFEFFTEERFERHKKDFIRLEEPAVATIAVEPETIFVFPPDPEPEPWFIPEEEAGPEPIVESPGFTPEPKKPKVRRKKAK
jgi:hypothetical protein